jgi:hypothetical protein
VPFGNEHQGVPKLAFRRLHGSDVVGDLLPRGVRVALKFGPSAWSTSGDLH